MKVTALCVFALLFTFIACAQEQPIAVNAYYSKEDPHWPAVEKMIDAAAAKYPRLKVNKIDIDTPLGYKMLHALEQISHEPTGDLTVTVEHVTLTSTGERRDVEKYFDVVVSRVLGLAGIKGKIPADTTGYAKDVFGKDARTIADRQRVAPSTPPFQGGENGNGADQDYDFYKVLVNDKPVGWVVNAYRKIDCPICSDTQFLIAIKSPELTVVGMRPVRELELRGIKAPEQLAQPFLAQFNGRAASAGEKRIDALSGATKTTLAYQVAVNEVLQEIQKREKK